MKGIIEGLLYVQGDLGLTIEQVSTILTGAPQFGQVVPTALPVLILVIS